MRHGRGLGAGREASRSVLTPSVETPSVAAGWLGPVGGSEEAAFHEVRPDGGGERAHTTFV